MPAGEFRARAWVSGNNPALAATAAALVLVAGCGGSPQPVAEAVPYLDPGFVEVDSYRLRYALTLARDLPATIAGSYGIEQRHNLALLALTLERRGTPTDTRVDAYALEAEAVSLTGERSALVLTRHDDPGGPTWLAPVDVRHRVPLTIEIRARATPGGPLLRARLTREFRLE